MPASDPIIEEKPSPSNRLRAVEKTLCAYCDVREEVKRLDSKVDRCLRWQGVAIALGICTQIWNVVSLFR
jgi:hypothetical protein